MVNGSGGLNKTCKAAEVLKYYLRMRQLNSWTKRCASLMPLADIGGIWPGRSSLRLIPSCAEAVARLLEPPRTETQDLVFRLNSGQPRLSSYRLSANCRSA